MEIVEMTKENLIEKYNILKDTYELLEEQYREQNFYARELENRLVTINKNDSMDLKSIYLLAIKKLDKEKQNQINKLKMKGELYGRKENV